MNKVLVFVNNKGGVGKTISSVNVGLGLAEKGFKTLLVDIDQQANATKYLGCTGEGVNNIADVFFNKMPITEAAMQTPYENLFLVPSGLAFVNSEQRLLGDTSSSLERRLKNAMRGHDFDYILIDCPPSLSTMITNALYVATHIIIPCATDGFSLDGLKNIIEKIMAAKQDYADDLVNYAILWTRIDKRQNIVKSLIDEGDKKELPTFETAIRASVRVLESTCQDMPLLVYAPNSNPAVDYRNLVIELMEWTKEQ